MKVEIFTLCEFASANPASGQLTIVGTFDHLGGIQTPIICPLCAIAIRIRFGAVEIGPKKIRLSFIDADGNFVVPTIEAPINVQMQKGDSNSTVPFVMIMQQLKLPHFGEYSIAVAVDGNEAGAIPLFARQVSPPGQMQLPSQQD